MDTWDDIRFFLAVTRYGTIRGAATALRVNHATVSRRLERLESRLGSRLLQRTPEGYRITADGEVLLRSAETIEAEVLGAVQRVEGSDHELAGIVRLTMSELVFGMTRDILSNILAGHPRLTIELSVSARPDDVALGRADIALRLSTRPPHDLVGRRIGHVPTAVFGAASSGHGPGTDLASVPWIRWQAPWQQVPIETWAQVNFPGAPVAARVDSYWALADLIRAGAGVGVLTPLGIDDDAGLVRITPDIAEAGLDLWLLMHPDIRGLRRVRAVVDAIVSDLRRRVGGAQARRAGAPDR